MRTRTLANSVVFVEIRAQKSCSRVEQINKKRDMDTERNSPRSNESQMNLKLHFGAVFWVSWGSLGRPKNIKLGIFVAFLVAASTHCFGHLPDYAKKQKSPESLRKVSGILGPFRRPKERCQHVLLRTRTLANSLVFVEIRAQKSCSRVEQINKKRDMDTERNSRAQTNLK